jgi:hypothetical protein
VAYGSNITEPIVTTIGNPVNNQTYQSTGVAYDVSIAGKPFFLLNDDDNPYRRVTAQYRKQQLDTTREPGEQTLTGWWLRSQSTFHLGQGVKFFEPAQDESLRFQYTFSKGCNVWDKGQVTLLKDVATQHLVTGGIQTNGRPWQYARSIQWDKNSNIYNGILLSDEYDVDKVFPKITVSISNKALTSNVATLTTGSAHGLSTGMQITISGVDATFNGEYRITGVPTTSTFTYAKTASDVTSTVVNPAGAGVAELIHFIDYNSGTDYPVYAICDDGVFAYWVTNVLNTGTPRLRVYKKLLSDDSSVSPTLMISANSITVTNAVMEYTKERIVMCVNDKVYEFSSSATTLPTAVYSHNDPDHTFTSITSSGAAIYVAGYSGIQSNIYKFTLESTGAMPTLSSAITAAELPIGEVTYKISYYLGYMSIGTNKGVRVAAIDAEGSIGYGPLIFESTQPIYDFAFKDKFIWCASGVDGQAGVTRINLGQEVSNLVFAYAWDLYDPADTLRTYTTTCAFLGETDRLAFCNAAGVLDGKIYLEEASKLVATATLRTGFIRYNTLENKIFKYVNPRFDTTDGGINILSVAPNGTEYNIGTFTQGASIGDVGIPYPTGGQQYIAFSFTFTRSVNDISKGPLFTGYQVKALPAIPRQRLIQYPFSCFDSESDKFGNKAGYEGYAYERIQALETIESNGDTLVITDFRTDEQFTGIIEEIEFINKTPSDKRYSGYGGLLLVTVRSIS